MLTQEDIPSVLALSKVQADIAQAATRAARSTVPTLIAVSKTYEADAIRPILEAGQRHFGENRVQETQEKWPVLKRDYSGVHLHLIGALQSNKAADAVDIFDVIHSVDRMSLVRALGAAMTKSGKRPACFIQVNTGSEDQKSGCAIAELGQILENAQALGLPVIGLMCLPPAHENPAPHFALLHKLARRHGLPELSMGMSEDFAVAVQLGATYVRVGSRIFGARSV
jgi:PLP dependent protein